MCEKGLRRRYLDQRVHERACDAAGASDVCVKLTKRAEVIRTAATRAGRPFQSVAVSTVVAGGGSASRACAPGHGPHGGAAAGWDWRLAWISTEADSPNI